MAVVLRKQLEKGDRIDLQEFNERNDLPEGFRRMATVIEIKGTYIRCKADAGYMECINIKKNKDDTFNNVPVEPEPCVTKHFTKSNTPVRDEVVNLDDITNYEDIIPAIEGAADDDELSTIIDFIKIKFANRRLNNALDNYINDYIPSISENELDIVINEIMQEMLLEKNDVDTTDDDEKYLDFVGGEISEYIEEDTLSEFENEYVASAKDLDGIAELKSKVWKYRNEFDSPVTGKKEKIGDILKSEYNKTIERKNRRTIKQLTRERIEIVNELMELGIDPLKISNSLDYDKYIRLLLKKWDYINNIIEKGSPTINYCECNNVWKGDKIYQPQKTICPICKSVLSESQCNDNPTYVKGYADRYVHPYIIEQHTYETESDNGEDAIYHDVGDIQQYRDWLHEDNGTGYQKKTLKLMQILNENIFLDNNDLTDRQKDLIKDLRKLTEKRQLIHGCYKYFKYVSLDKERRGYIPDKNKIAKELEYEKEESYEKIRKRIVVILENLAKRLMPYFEFSEKTRFLAEFAHKAMSFGGVMNILFNWEWWKCDITKCRLFEQYIKHDNGWIIEVVNNYFATHIIHQNNYKCVLRDLLKKAIDADEMIVTLKETKEIMSMVAICIYHWLDDYSVREHELKTNEFKEKYDKYSEYEIINFTNYEHEYIQKNAVRKKELSHIQKNILNKDVVIRSKANYWEIKYSNTKECDILYIYYWFVNSYDDKQFPVEHNDYMIKKIRSEIPLGEYEIWEHSYMPSSYTEIILKTQKIKIILYRDLMIETYTPKKTIIDIAKEQKILTYKSTLHEIEEYYGVSLIKPEVMTKSS